MIRLQTLEEIANFELRIANWLASGMSLKCYPQFDIRNNLMVP